MPVTFILPDLYPLHAKPSSPNGVALHSPWIRRSFQSVAISRRRNEPPLGPVGADLDAMTAAEQFLDRYFRNAAFDNENARPRGARPEGGGKVLRVPSGRVNLFLQVQSRMDVP